MSVPATGAQFDLVIDGMHCESCVRRATQALTRAGLGEVKSVSIGHATVAAPADAAPGTVAALIAALGKAGFSARVRE